MMLYWQFYGFVNNISYGVSPQAQVNERTSRTVVVNCTIAKDARISNIWGENRVFVEGSRFGYVVRRAGGSNPATLGCPEITPWCDREQDTPSLMDRGYHRPDGTYFEGYYFPLGKCWQMGEQNISERKRRDAIGNTGKPEEIVHDAYGTLPTFYGIIRIG